MNKPSEWAESNKLSPLLAQLPTSVNCWSPTRWTFCPNSNWKHLFHSACLYQYSKQFQCTLLLCIFFHYGGRPYSALRTIYCWDLAWTWISNIQEFYSSHRAMGRFYHLLTSPYLLTPSFLSNKIMPGSIKDYILGRKMHLDYVW